MAKVELEEEFGRVYMPSALERKYLNANREWAWQYIFPTATRSIDPRSGIERRHHVSKLVLQRAVKAAIRKAGIANKPRQNFRYLYGLLS
jgi:hypothetical protein